MSFLALTWKPDLNGLAVTLTKVAALGSEDPSNKRVVNGAGKSLAGDRVPDSGSRDLGHTLSQVLAKGTAWTSKKRTTIAPN